MYCIWKYLVVFSVVSLIKETFKSPLRQINFSSFSFPIFGHVCIIWAILLRIIFECKSIKFCLQVYQCGRFRSLVQHFIGKCVETEWKRWLRGKIGYLAYSNRSISIVKPFQLNLVPVKLAIQGLLNLGNLIDFYHMLVRCCCSYLHEAVIDFGPILSTLNKDSLLIFWRNFYLLSFFLQLFKVVAAINSLHFLLLVDK